MGVSSSVLIGVHRRPSFFSLPSDCPMLNSVSEFYEEDVQNALATAMALIEPVILIVMGVVVAFVLISLYLPIFSLGSEGLR